MFPSTTVADVSQATITTTAGDLDTKLVENVMRFAEPLFQLFDFKTIDRSVYTDIVEKFSKGQVG